MKKTLVGLTACAFLALAPTAFADSPKSTQTYDCNGLGTIAFTGSPTLWPPNHKFRDYSITATSTVPVDQVTLDSAVANSDVVDGEELNGTGNTATDVTNNPGTDSGTGSATVEHQVRGERSGHSKAGRTYTFSETATFGMGAIPCSTMFTVTVPHDQSSKTKVTVVRTSVAQATRARRG